MKRILVNVDNCSGCRRCEVLCAFAHEDKFRPSVARINVLREDAWGFDLPVFCNHCKDCTAIKRCPSDALHRDAKGLITVNAQSCNGCGNCVRACRLHAIRLHPDRNTPLICDFCRGKVLCVEKCPTKALTFTDTSHQRPSPPYKIMKDALKRWRIVA